MQDGLVKNEKRLSLEEDLGFILWKVQTIEDILPYYKNIMKKE